MIETKSLKRQAAEGFIISFVGDSLYKILGIVTTFVVLAVLTPYEYGLWRLILSVLSFMGIIALTGIAGVVVADISRELGQGNKARAYAATWRATHILVGASVCAGVLLFCVAPIISAISKIHLTVYLWILAGSLVFGGITQVLQILFQAYLEPRRALILKNAANASYLIALIFCIPYLKLSVFGLVIAYTISILVPILLFIPYAIREFRTIARERDRSSYSLREVLIRRGGWALLTDYVSILETSLWPWIVGYFLSIEQVAYAGLAVVITSQVYSLVPLQYVLRSILPRMADSRERMQEWTARASRYSIWMHTSVALLIFFGFTVATWFFFPRYIIAIPIVAVLLVVVPFRAVSVVIIEWMYSVRNQRGIFLSTSVPRLIWIVFLPVLLMFFGIAGFVIWYVGSSLSIIFARFAVSAGELSLPKTLRAYIVPDATDYQLLNASIHRGLSYLRLVRKNSLP